MKLWYSPASPFVRKCLLVARERDLFDRLELLDASTTVINPNESLMKDNPTGKIPALVLDDGTTLFDSRVICAYLDSLHDGKKLMPRSGDRRFKIMTLEALADNIMDSAVANRYERRLRPPEYQWSDWSEGLMRKVRNGINHIEKEWVPTLGRTPNMGSIAVASLLGYLDFRYPDWNWRRGHPKLTRWFKRFSERDSFKATAPE